MILILRMMKTDTWIAIETHVNNLYEQQDYVSHLSVLLPVRLQAVIFCSFWFWGKKLNC